MKACSTILALAIASLLFAQGGPGLGDPPPEGAFAPGIDPSPPYYFAGTYCIAQGVVYPYQNTNVAGDEYIVFADLKINGNTVRSYPNGPTQGNSPIALAARFDSSYFPSGSSITVSITATDNLGVQYSASYSAPAKNKILALNQPSITNYSAPHSDAASGFLAGPNILSKYSHYHSNQSKYDESEQFFQQSLSNVMVLGVHGNSSTHDTGLADDFTMPPYPDNTIVDPFEAEQAQSSNIGTGLPPRNSSHNPPLQFVYIVSCNSGDTNDFVRYLYPYQQYSGFGWLENQAVAAFNVYVLIESYTQFGYYLKSQLAVGHSLFMSRRKMANYAEEYPNSLMVRSTNTPTLSRPFEESDLSILGDPYLRVKNVYRIDHVQSMEWHN